MINDLPPKYLIADSFGRAATGYDDVAVLQRQTADKLLDRLQPMTIKPQYILDLGTGTGRNLGLLTQRYPQAQLIALDIADRMLQQAQYNYQRQDFKSPLANNKPHYIVGDAEALPLADSSIDLIFANLALQWCDPHISFAEIQRVLKPRGLIVFTTLGPDTLYELKQSWARVDEHPHVNRFYDMSDISDAIIKAGLADIVLDMDYYKLNYDTAMTLMQDLKALGARNMNRQRRQGLTGKHRLAMVQQAYEIFRKDGILPATYEVISGHAWCGV